MAHSLVAEDGDLAEQCESAQRSYFILRRAAEQTRGEGEARFIDLSHAAFMKMLQAGCVFDFSAREQQPLAFDLAAACDERHERLEHLAEKLEQFLPWRVLARERRAHMLRDLAHVLFGVLDDRIDDRAEQAFFTAEVILNGRQVDAGLFGELTCARAVIAFGGEHLEGCLEDAPAALFSAALIAGTKVRDGGFHGRSPTGDERAT